jgi:hypothetical protein
MQQAANTILNGLAIGSVSDYTAEMLKDWDVTIHT